MLKPIEKFNTEKKKESQNGSPGRAIWLSVKRADFQNYSPREPFWLSFFLSEGRNSTPE